MARVNAVCKHSLLQKVSHLSSRRHAIRMFHWSTLSLRNKESSKGLITSLPDINNPEIWVAKLSPDERHILLACLQKNANDPTSNGSSDASGASLTTKQLFHVGVHSSLPFVGFGFLDNAIMIIAGDYIDLTIGTALGISTMAAAALGNAVSDVAGVGSAHFVESFSRKLGVPQPNLDQKQFSARATKWAVNIGRAIGVALGCILGMVPLLFLPTTESKSKSSTKEEKASS